MRQGAQNVPKRWGDISAQSYIAVKEGGVVGPGEASMPSLKAGLYEYLPETHSLRLVKPVDVRPFLAKACFGQGFIADAPVSIAITAEPERTTLKYGKRGYRYIYIEVGHADQNIYLATTALGLGTVAVGAFNDLEVRSVLGIRPDEYPLYIMPVRRPKK